MARGSIEKRGETSYRLIVSSGLDGTGKQIKHTKTVKGITRDEADTELALFIADIEKGNIAKSGKMTLSQYYDYWKENYSDKNHEATTKAYNENLFTRIKEALGHKRLDKIEPKYLLDFYKNLAEPGIKKVQRKKNSTEPLSVQSLSDNTIRKHHVLLKTLFNKAVQWNLLPYNPADRVEPPKATHTRKEVYDQEQLGLFLQALESEEIKYKIMVHLALAGGLRREEIFGLEWRHFDLEKNTVRIEQAAVYTPKTGTIDKGTKNSSSNRLISIPVSTVELIKQYKIEKAKKRLKLGNKWRSSIPAEEKKVETEKLFTTWNGEPAHPHSFNKWLSRFIAENNLPHISPHMFRHMSATYLIASKADIRTVSGKLGHAQTSTTMNIYSHLLKSTEEETANTLENFMQQATEKAKTNQKKQA